MNVELLYFEGCPNSRIVDDRLTVLEAELEFHLSRRAASLVPSGACCRRGVDSAGGVGAEVAGATTRTAKSWLIAAVPTAPLRQKRFVPSASTATLPDTSPTGCQNGPTPEETSRWRPTVARL